MNEIDIALARMVLAGPSLVEVHVKPDVKITVLRLMEVMAARRTLAAGVPGALYFIAPGELDWEAAALQTDFFGPEGDSLKALAVMVDGAILTTVVNLYFGLFPGRSPVKVFDDVEAGYAWLAKQGFIRTSPLQKLQ